MLKEIGSVFSFLTIFPSSNATLENIAKFMYLFPIVGIAIEATTNKLTNKGSKMEDNPNPKEPINRPTTIPTIGKTNMYFAIFSKVALDDGRIVKNEKTDPISLSMNPPSNY